MDSLIETFHLDVKLLLAQMVNFGVAFCVLYFFGLKPLFKTMRARSDKIAQSLKDGQEIEKKLSQTEADYKRAILKAKKEAVELMEKVNVQAEERKKEIVAKAKEEIAQTVSIEKEKIVMEKSRLLGELKAEVADLVVASVEKVLGNNAKVDLGEDFIKKTLDKK